jgi:hypothetical protein
MVTHPSDTQIEPQKNQVVGDKTWSDVSVHLQSARVPQSESGGMAGMQLASADQLLGQFRDTGIRGHAPLPAEKPLVEVENGTQTGKASKQFQDRVQKVFNSLPEDIKAFAKKAGVHIFVGPTVDRDHPDGLGEEALNSVMLSEKNLKNESDSMLAEVMRHEIAHAYDDITQKSFNRDFRKSLNADFDRLAKEDPEFLKHLNPVFAERGPDGRLTTRAFREFFAQLASKATGPDSEAVDYAKHFPDAYKWMKEHFSFSN